MGKALEIRKEFTTKTNEEELIQFYNEATKDYEFWSKDLNMHFGYYIPFKTNPFKRDTMLNEMNNQLFSMLNLNYENKKHIADLGCGMGGTMNYGIQKYPNVKITGCTLSPFQVEYGNKFINNERAEIKNRDYRDTNFESNSFDAAIAIESFCHSGCSSAALKEAHRILKPNSKLIIADAFVKTEVSKMNPFSKYVHNGLSKNWSLEKLGNINETKKELEALGFKNIKVQNIWYRVAPSVLHVPFAISGFTLRKIFKREKLQKESIDNLKGSFFTLLTSLCMQDFSYYIISAEKNDK